MAENECLFCKIVNGDVPAKKVYEDEHAVAFLDISPRNPGHTIVVPKKHAETILSMSPEDVSAFFLSVRIVAGKVMTGTRAQGLSISQSNGKAAGQVISHVHVHVIPRFINEGPAGLESILPTKRLDDNTMTKIADSIELAEEEGVEIPEAKEEEPKEEKEEPEEKPEKEEEKEEEPAEKKKKPEKEDEDEEFFNF